MVQFCHVSRFIRRSSGRYVRSHGAQWHEWANWGETEAGEILSGWLLKHAAEPARVAEPESETPYTTTRAIAFMEQAKGHSWCLHRPDRSD